VIGGFIRDIEDSESANYPHYGRGVTMISAHDRIVQVASGTPVNVAGVTVHEGDYVIADRRGSVFVPAARIEEVIDLGELAAKEAAMADKLSKGAATLDLMGLKAWRERVSRVAEPTPFHLAETETISCI